MSSGRPKWKVEACVILVFYVVIYLECFLSMDSGKTAMAATVGIESDFPYVKIVSLLNFWELGQFLEINHKCTMKPISYCLFPL